MQHSPYVCLAISVVFAFLLGLIALMVVVAWADGSTAFGPAPAEDDRGEGGGAPAPPGGPMTWEDYNR